MTNSRKRAAMRRSPMTRAAGDRWRPLIALAGASLIAMVASLAPGALSAQGLTYTSGQSVSPAFEGWEQNEDGSYSLVFGYMNRNWAEQPDVAIGPENAFSPGPADRGQPTHFLPRRNRFVFKVRVPPDFGDKELVWTLTTNGETLKAYGSLRPDYFIDNVVVMSETGTLGAGTSSPELREQKPPSITLETPDKIEARVGEPVQIVALLTDDGLPRRDGGSLPRTEDGEFDFETAVRRVPSRITVNKIMGLYLSWFVHRAPEGVEAQEAVSFYPPQVHPWEDTRPYSNSPWSPFWVPPQLPEDGRWIVEVTFDEPGTYILMGRADDGGLLTDEFVTVQVSPATS